MPNFKGMTVAEIEWFLSYSVTMWSYENSVPITNIKLKEMRTDALFGNKGGSSFIAQINVA